MQNLSEILTEKFKESGGNEPMCVCHYCKELCFKPTRITVYYPVEQRLCFYHPKCYPKVDEICPQIVLAKKDWRKER